MAIVELYVTFMDHAGAAIGTFKLMDPTYQFLEDAPGGFTGKIGLRQTTTGGAAITADMFAPKATDYILKVSDDGGSSFTEVQGGFLTSVEVKGSEGCIYVAGKDWMEWLNQPFPFDYSNPGAFALTDTTSAVVRYWVNATEQTIIDDIIGAYNGIDVGITITTNFVGSTFTNTLTKSIQFQDPTTGIEHLRGIAELASPYGFNMFMDWDKTLYFYGPGKVTDPTSVTPYFSMSGAYGTDADPIIDLDWRNDGPLATDTVVFLGYGGNVKPWGYKTFAGSVTAYRRWTKFRTLGQIESLTTAVSNPTWAQLSTALGKYVDAYPDRQPQRKVTCRVRPDRVGVLLLDQKQGYTNFCGETVNINYAFSPYHTVNANFYVTSQSYSFDESGNPVLDLGLEQVYATF